MSYPYWRELIVVWALVLLGLNHLRDGRSIIEWIRDIGEDISDVFHEFFGETCPYCGKWYFSKRKAFRCCEHTALAKLNKKRGQEALAKRRKERRNGTYWRRSAPLIDNDPLSSSSTLPPVIHYCSICGNAYTGAFCNICGNPSYPPY